ncbi:PepSY domain-containing protein [Halothiobacillus sp. DCM-1]|uniref:PepSY domain-containing protein n=1 Tax=Halothiobacillus sp. DCM-1 TaxID=3112558 RepID=UPI00324BA24D
MMVHQSKLHVADRPFVQASFRWLHRWAGILAGLVLAVVGATGAIMSFQDDLLRWVNPGVMRVVVPEAGAVLPLPELVARIEAQKRSQPIATLRWTSNPEDSVWVGFRTRGRPEGEFVNPYTGELLGKARGEEFFHTVENLHRRLLAGEVGKAITGASALIFLALAISGILIRLRRAGLKYWLVPIQRGSAAAKIHSWHSVFGTWFLLPFVLVILTGLYWSYDWSRNLWHELSGAPKGKPVALKLAEASQGALDWQAISDRLSRLPATRVQFFVPAKPDEALRVMWQDSETPHQRAFNTLQLNPSTGAVLADQRFADQPVGTRLVRSMFALHSGEYFGIAGVWVMFFASLSLPLFFLSGGWLYLRRKFRHSTDAAPESAAILVVYASQTGTAERLAQMTAQRIEAAQKKVKFLPLEALSPRDIDASSVLLFIVSTFGDGEAPDHAAGAFETLFQPNLSMTGRRFAILGLGDRRYQKFCGFAEELRARLLAAQAVEWFPLRKVDQADPATINDWFVQIAAVCSADSKTQTEADTAQWQLRRRQLLNPSGVGGATYEIELACPDTLHANWQAGALVEILPQHARDHVLQWLNKVGIEAGQPVMVGEQQLQIEEVLVNRELHQPPVNPSPQDLQSWVDGLPRLAARTYSVASLPDAGIVRLLVRQVKNAAGELGLASGWLTAHARLGESVTVRLRQNPSFLPMLDANVPCLFIANGTGMAGIRAQIEARIAAGARRNWLILGERTPQDAYWSEMWRLWETQGFIERIDWVFSRIPTAGEMRYVQHKLGAAHREVKKYLDDQAVVFVCGSAQGMAPAVASVFASVLGAEKWREFRRSGRYRQDVY